MAATASADILRLKRRHDERTSATIIKHSLSQKDNLYPDWFDEELLKEGANLVKKEWEQSENYQVQILNSKQNQKFKSLFTGDVCFEEKDFCCETTTTS